MVIKGMSDKEIEGWVNWVRSSRLDIDTLR